MADVATLGVGVDTSNLRAATSYLDAWAATAMRTEKAIGAAARAMGVLSDNSRLSGSSISKIGAGIVDLGTAFAKTIGKSTQLVVSLKAVQEHANGVGKASNMVPSNSANFESLRGGATLKFVLDQSSQTGQPLLKTDEQKGAELISGFLKESAGFIPRKDMKIGSQIVSSFLDGEIDKTVYNRLLKFQSETDARYTYAAKRNEDSGDEIPQYKDDLRIAREKKRLSDIIITPRIDINKKYDDIDDSLRLFSGEYKDFDSYASVITKDPLGIGPNGPFDKIAVAYKEMKNALANRDLTEEHVNRVKQSFDEALSMPKNAEFVPRLRAMRDAFTSPSNEMISGLESIGRLREQAQNALSVMVKQSSTDGSAASQRGPNASSLSGANNQSGNGGVVPSTNDVSMPKNFWDQIIASAGLVAPNISGALKGFTSLTAVTDRFSFGQFRSAITDANAEVDAQQRLDRSFRENTKSRQANTEQTTLGTQASVQSAAATDNVKLTVVTLKQSQDSLQKSCAARLQQLPQLTKMTKEQAATNDQLAASQEKLVVDMDFERAQIGRSTIDQTVAKTLKDRGLPVEMDSKSAEIVRTNEQLKYARELAGDFTTTLVNGLRSGEGFWKSMGNAAVTVLKKISDRLLNDVLNSLFQVNSAAGSGGGGGFFGGLLNLLGFGGGSEVTLPTGSNIPIPMPRPSGFANGGYTGYGGVYEPVGIVHAGEVVWSQKDIARAGGVGVVEAMRLGRRGYADGGVVGEGGPQLVPAQPDAAVPVRRLRADNQNDGTGSASGVHVTVGVSVDEDGNLKAYVKNVAQSEAQSSTRQGLNDFNQQLPDRVAQINRNPRRR
ncbi:hypothetical protein [Rhizobium lusitanum]|uniref:Phage tail tape measure protein n=1 Tax=Rhizobium lusitanum TaxID=293958 RepID=A0A7X0IPP8_9HYPH|nr:hypothetical protein [Rhizobium lusitanum]MBB6484871.1 hypothetical protein [Rhizobium lusitanum]